MLRPSLAVAALAASLSIVAVAQVRIDPRLPKYQPVQGVSGNIKTVGSDTMNNLMTLWGEKYRQMYPNVEIEVEGKGSSTAPPALIAATATFGPMSREMKSSEIDAFEQRFGYKPTLLRTGIDMLALYVHKDNPIAQQGLTLQQVDAIFSKTRKGGQANDIRTWGDVGLSGEWANKPITIYGRNSASGTYGYFKKYALFGGDFKDNVNEQPGSSSVVQGIATDRYGVGYSGLGYMTADVAAVPIAPEPGAAAVQASADYVSSYPLTRFLYVYVNYQPGSKIDPLRGEFIKLIYSQEGQEVIIKDGYLPVTLPIARKALVSVGIDSP